MFSLYLADAWRDLPCSIQWWVTGVVELTIANETIGWVAVIDLRSKFFVGSRWNGKSSYSQILWRQASDASGQSSVRRTVLGSAIGHTNVTYKSVAEA